MSELDVETGGLKRTFKDLFAGAAGGVAQVLLGQYSGESGSYAWRRSLATESLQLRFFHCFLLWIPCYFLLNASGVFLQSIAALNF